MKYVKKALITGICGQDGAYLAQSLLNEGYKVIGLTRRSSQDHMGRLRVLNLDTKIDIRSIDCLLYTSPSPRDRQKSRMTSSA